MKYTLAFACSQDGFIAKHSKDNPFEWTSKEDQNQLQTQISENEWQELYELSEGTFVEESEQLKKSAAGAGLTDND